MNSDPSPPKKSIIEGIHVTQAQINPVINSEGPHTHPHRTWHAAWRLQKRTVLCRLAAFSVPPIRRSSMSNVSVAFGGMSGGAPCSMAVLDKPATLFIRMIKDTGV